MLTARFFDMVRPRFGGRLTQAQVDGLNLIGDACAAARANRQKAAYIFATAFYETGGRMEPVREGFASSDAAAERIVAAYCEKHGKANYAARDPETGQSYYGRGLVQLTHRVNYAKMGKRLGIDLEHDPDLALDPATSAVILVDGMLTGAFTGISLDDVSEPETSDPDFTNDRAVVNGRDRAAEIARHAMVFYEALRDVDLLSQSRTITAAKKQRKASDIGTIATTGTAIVVGAGKVLTEQTNDLIATAQQGITLANVLQWQSIGWVLALVLVVILIFQRAQANRIEAARRDDNETRGV